MKTKKGKKKKTSETTYETQVDKWQHQQDEMKDRGKRKDNSHKNEEERKEKEKSEWGAIFQPLLLKLSVVYTIFTLDSLLMDKWER